MNWHDFFKDVDGSSSFKRLQTGIYLGMFIILFFVNLFTGYTVDDSIIDFLVFLNCYSYTGIAIERFGKMGTTRFNAPPPAPTAPSVETPTKEVKEIPPDIPVDKE